MNTIFEVRDRQPLPAQHSRASGGVSWGQHLATVSGASQECLQQLSSIHLLKLIEESIKMKDKVSLGGSC